MATTALTNLGAVTVHSWAGLMDGRYSQEDLYGAIHTDKFTEIRKKITETEVLILDEISMISSRTFDQLEYVTRLIRNPQKIFGGLQVILAGSFKQLPPIPARRYGDQGDFAFQSEVFEKIIVHHVHLKDVVRQTEKDLIIAVNELCSGNPSDTTHELIENLSRPIINEDDEAPTYLYSTNFDVEFHNQMCLSDGEGDIVYYKADDEGGPLI